MSFADGDIIFREGELNDLGDIYFIRSGNVQIITCDGGASPDEPGAKCAAL